MFVRNPETRQFEIASRLPDALCKRATSEWADRNLAGAELDAFLEGPTFDSSGNLYVVDIAFGRILSLSAEGNWSVVTEYDGWPNGMKLLDDRRFLVTDHKNGLLEVARDTGQVHVISSGFEGKPFHGLNDLTIASSGDIYFTDQGQSGLHAPHGCVFRLSPDGELTILVSNIPSPNGLVLSRDERTLFLAVTRANAVWRVPMTPDGSVTKVGTFIQLSGGVGPDGMARPDGTDALLVAHPGLGVWQFRDDGTPDVIWQLDGYAYTTNLAANPVETDSYFVTESLSAAILRFQVNRRNGA